MNQQPGLLKRCFEIFRRSPALFVGVAVMPYATLHAGLLALTWSFLQSKGAGEVADLRAALAAMTTTDTLGFVALFLLQITVPYAVAGRGISRVASEQIAGREITFLKEVGDMLAFLPSAIVLAVIAGIAAFVGVGFFLIPGFVAGALFSLVLPAGAVEGIGPFAALRRGLSLVWRVAGRVLLLFFAYGALVFAVTILQGISLAAMPHTFLMRAPIFAIWTFVPIVPLALLYICFTLLYFEARASQPIGAASV